MGRRAHAKRFMRLLLNGGSLRVCAVYLPRTSSRHAKPFLFFALPFIIKMQCTYSKTGGETTVDQSDIRGLGTA